jgi:hypothetical protein
MNVERYFMPSCGATPPDLPTVRRAGVGELATPAGRGARRAVERQRQMKISFPSMFGLASATL